MDVQKLKNESGLKGSSSGEIASALRNFGQAASNSVAETVSAPVDAIAWALRKAGVPNSIVGDKPVMGSDWMAEKGFTRPTQEGVSKMAGDFVGMVSPLAFEKSVATQLAGALRNGLPKNIPVGNMFIGESANTWDAVSAAQAKALEKQGKTPQEIWKETGTFKGVDGKYRQEIPDDMSNVVNLPINKNWEQFAKDAEIEKYGRRGAPSVSSMKAKDFKDFQKWRNGVEQQYNTTNKTMRPLDEILQHEQLNSAYPDVVNKTSAFWDKSMGKEGAYGQGKISFGDVSNPDSLKGLLLHETQHAIQGKEGFARGGSPEEFNGAVDMYRKLAGEAEARAVQARMNMNQEQRRATFPLDSYDIPANQLIVK